jgi:hypothetical protein
VIDATATMWRSFQKTAARLLSVSLHQLLVAWIGAQRGEVGTGIQRGEIAISSVERFLQRGQSFFFITISSVSRTQPEKVDGSSGLLLEDTHGSL